ncbi:MAG TPA: response regulator [Bacteroidia bacterium]|jgi:CheY-like chemotaxis protein
MIKKKPAKFNIVMLVDDSEVDNFINLKMIEGCNFAEKIYTHTSGRSGIEFLRSLSMNPQILSQLLPEIIFLDINMPVMDGFAFVKEFDKLPIEVVKHCKIIVLTSSINPEDIANSKRSDSIVRYVNKPLSRETLMGIENPARAEKNG